MASFKISGYEDIPVDTPVEQIPGLVARARKGATSYKTLPLDFRRGQLRNLYYALYDNLDVLYAALYKDLHKSRYEVDLTETYWVLSEIAWYIKNLDSLAAAEPVTGLPLALKLAKTVITKQPLGTVLIITPWNYPVFLTVSPIAAAIAAGNTVVYKPSELSEHTSRALVKILSSALDPEVFASVTGGVPQSTALLKNKFDKIMYTGNGVVGRIVARAAAENLTPTLLELGGKSPVVITKTANLRIAARRVLWGKQVNSGQTCVAPDYVLVQESVRADFIAHLKTAYHEFNSELSKSSEDYSHIINDRHFARVKAYLDNTKGTVVLGGNHDAATRFFPPTIVDGIDADDSLLKEEIFGPLLGLVSFGELSEAVAFITREHDTPLALYVFSTDKREQQYVLDRVRCGGACVNDTLMQTSVPHAPFGGVGESGAGGGYHGRHGFDAFSHHRTVLAQPNYIDGLLAVRYPPYGAAKGRQFDFLNGPSASPGFPRVGTVKSASAGIAGLIGWLWSKSIWFVVALAGFLLARK